MAMQSSSSSSSPSGGGSVSTSSDGSGSGKEVALQQSSSTSNRLTMQSPPTPASDPLAQSLQFGFYTAQGDTFLPGGALYSDQRGQFQISGPRSLVLAAGQGSRVFVSSDTQVWASHSLFFRFQHMLIFLGGEWDVLSDRSMVR